ncbi:FUSC family protein [Streptomyces sp. A1277]|uniref:FUSC family protein n=1 Tax=Streptomyces sp. A1277 TaxID=2563103 RepID=UPI001F0E386D|nr:FUSC family protein [Streptomyces sp. A1277]
MVRTGRAGEGLKASWDSLVADGRLPGRYQLVQSLKAAAAAALAWAVTGWWLAAPMALMAPWAAVALVQGTVYRSLRSAVELLAMMASGTLLAAGAAAVTGDTMAAMLIALPLTVLLGNWAPVGEQGLYAPTTALFVLAYGSYSLPAVGHRLLETAVGAAVGVAVNAIVLPPVHSLRVRTLACALPRDCSLLLHDLSEGIVEEYDEEQAGRWHQAAGELPGALSELRSARGWASESFRFNPGHRLRRSTPSPSDKWDVVWAQVGNRLLTLTLTLWETASEQRALPRPPGRSLECLSAVLAAAAEVCAADQTIMEQGPDDACLEQRAGHLAEARRALADAKEHLHGPGPDAGASLGSLVAGCQALLDDLTPDDEGSALPAGARPHRPDLRSTP